MRSEAIFRAKETVENKYQLCQLAAKAARRIHIPAQNTQETISSAFEKIAVDKRSPDAETNIR